MSFEQMRTSHLLAILFAVFLFSSTTNAQPGCPDINAGPNKTLACGTTCTNLTATYFNTGNTNSYGVSSIPYTPFSYTAGTSILVNQDDIWSPVINLPFTFCFFGKSYNQVVVGANGLISFDASLAGSGCVWNTMASGTFPTTNMYQNVIMGVYHDIDPSKGGTIKYQLIGTAPCRMFIISWSDVKMYDDVFLVGSCWNTPKATHQIVIYETTNAIEVYVKNRSACTGWNDGLGTLGIQDETGTKAYVASNYNNSVWNASNQAWRFTPNGTSIVTVDWLQGGNVIGTGATVNVCPSTATTYTARATYQPCDGGTPVVETSTVTVSPNLSFQAMIDSSKNITCKGKANGAAYAHVTGGLAPVTYGWNTAPNQTTITNLAPGNYTFTATDGSGCSITNNVTITEPANLVATVPNDTQITCSGTGKGTLVAKTSGGTAPYTYKWSNSAQTDSVLDNINAGTYTVTVTDSKGCTITASGTLTLQTGNNNVTVASQSITNVSCKNGTNGSITVSATGGSGIYNYTWSNNDSTATISNLPKGSYTVSVNDGAGCTATGTYSITEPNAVIISNPIVKNISCNGGSNGSIQITTTGGTGTLTSNWSNSGTGNSITSLAVGSYKVTVADQNGCADSATYNITEPSVFSLTTTHVNVNCNGASTGSISVTKNGGVGTITYAWNNGAATKDLTNIPAGNYCLTATDNNSCTATVCDTITQPTALTATTSHTDVTCNGLNNGTVTVNTSGGTSPYTFMGNPLPPGAVTLPNLAANTYAGNITDSKGCTFAVSETVAQPTALNVTETHNNVSCNGAANDGSITLTASGGTTPYTFDWGGGIATQNRTNIGAGNYTVTVTDAKSCTFNLSVTITEPSVLDITVQNTVNIGCNGGTGNIDVATTGGTTPYGYSWIQQGTGNTFSTQNLSGISAGFYQVTVTDARGCTDTTSTTITQAPSITASLVSKADAKCSNTSDGTATITTSGTTGAVTFSWDNGETDSTAINLAAGTHTVTATDANNCRNTVSVVIGAPDSVYVTSFTTDSTSCFGSSDGSITIVAAGGAGGYTYIWSNAQTADSAVNLTKGSYAVTITDANNCTNIFSASVEEPTPATVSVTTLKALCFAQASGTATATAQGGNAPYSFAWSAGNGNGANASGFAAGNYTLTVTDNYGCTVTQTFTIGEEDSLKIQATTTPESCTYNSDGTITLSSFGGVPSYAYSIDGNGLQQNNTNGFFDNIPDGNYTVTVRDNNNCLTSILATVQPAAPDDFYIQADSTTCFGDVYKDGRLIVTPISPANEPYTYSINSGSDYRSTGRFDSLAYGDYIIQVKNKNNCQVSLVATVPQPEKLEVQISPNPLEIDLGESATISVSHNGRHNITYVWTPAEGLSCTDCESPLISSFVETEYTLFVKDSPNGRKYCTAETTLKVLVGPHGKVLVPNMFSPNGDGLNDVFYVYGNNVREVKLTVFNRWGEKVFDATSVYSGWDGTYKNEPQGPGVYTYVVEFTFLDNQKLQKQGTVTLVR